MNVAIIYASHHGHTRHVCERIAEGLRGRGVDAEIANADELPDGFSLTRYDAAVLAGSVHYSRHPRSLVHFAKEHRHELDAMPSALVSVSLAAADPKGAGEAREVAEHFAERTGWHPAITAPVAGALPYRSYNPLLRLIMRQIARLSGAATDTKHDHIYTDWDQVDAVAARVGESLQGRRPEEGPSLSPS